MRLRSLGPAIVIAGCALLTLTGCSSDPGGATLGLSAGITQTIDVGASVYEVEFSPNGQMLSVATASRVAIWEIDDGHAVKTTQEFAVPAGQIYATAWSPDGKAVAVTGEGLYLWNIETGESITATDTAANRGSLDLAFSPDGAMIATAETNSVITLWDGRTLETQGDLGGIEMAGHTDKVSAVAFSPDSERLVSGGWDETVRTWDVAARQQTLLSYTDGHGTEVDGVLFSADGDVVAAIQDNSHLELWNAADGAFIYKDPTAAMGGSDAAVAASPKLPIFAATAGHQIRFLDSRSGAPVGDELTGHSEPIRSLSFRPDGSTLASGSWDGTIRLWDVSSVRP